MTAPGPADYDPREFNDAAGEPLTWWQRAAVVAMFALVLLAVAAVAAGMLR